MEIQVSDEKKVPVRDGERAESNKLRTTEPSKIFFPRVGPAGEHVQLTNVGLGRYVGGIMADVLLANGCQLAAPLITLGLGRESGRGPREGWCDRGSRRSYGSARRAPGYKAAAHMRNE